MLEDLQKAIELDPQLAPAHLDLIAYHLKISEIEQAEAALEQSKDILEQSALWYTYQAQVEIAQENYSAAYQQAQQALELDQGLLPAYRIVGQTALLSEKTKEALSALEIYLDYETEDAQAWLWKGQALYETGKYRDAIKAINNALDIASDLPEAHHYRGLAYLELNEGQSAVNDFLVALRGNTQSFSHHLNLGRALLAAERFGDARGQFNTCENLAETDEELAQVYYYRALASEGLENRPWAIRDWQALLALPKESAPQAWLKQAVQQLTPTPSSTTSAASSKTSTPTLTPTPKP